MRKKAKKRPPVLHYIHNAESAKKPSKKPIPTTVVAGPATTVRKMVVKHRSATKKRAAKTDVPYLTISEKDRLFAAIRDPRDRAIFRLLYHHGMRASEIGRMELSDFRPGSKVELDRLFIRRLKGSLSGETAAVPAAAQAIRGWIRKRGHVDGPLFITRERTRISRSRVFQLMRHYCAIADIPLWKAHPHTLKHSCATHLVSDKREAIIEVQRHLGHASITSTMVYAKLIDEANDARAKRLREWR